MKTQVPLTDAETAADITVKILPSDIKAIDLPTPHRRNMIDAPTAAPLHHRILVIDDSESTAQLFSMMLETLGHKVKYALDAMSAFEIMDAYAPDVVFCDLAMDGFDGYEFARRVRADGDNRNLVLVVHSGFSDQRHRDLAASVGYDLFLPKPLEFKTLKPLFLQIDSRHAWDKYCADSQVKK